MKKCSRLSVIFLLLGAVVLAAGLLHTGIAYGLEILRQRREPFATSFPPEVMLFVFVPYALALCLLCTVWFCLYERRRGIGRLDVAICTCGLFAALTACGGIVTVLFVAVNGGGMDAASFFGVLTPFLAVLAPLLTVTTVCSVWKDRRAAKARKKERREEEL